ncbi:MAG: D-alanyl-D-alanine carboxypeptidase [Ignavibacteriaceae bacterium]|nr:D-alanyl-D-alanine carboxypeptidase [Ignavibacteriaceae bacterium]
MRTIVFTQRTKLVDGSGISRFDQVTAGAIVGLLEKVYFNIDQYDDFLTHSVLQELMVHYIDA